MKNQAVSVSHDVEKRILSVVSSASGNLVEWYDFYVYAFASIYFSSQFFPSDGDVVVELLKASAVFFIGFLMRPIGGWLFGFIADRYGRKRSMLISVAMMCSGSFLVAILPTYETIGTAAAVLLLLLRMLQGLSAGGEYGTAATYMSEIALKNRRGFIASFQSATLIGGQLLASLVIFILALYLTEDQLRAWGWRIPFAIGGLAAIVAVYLRRSLHETTTKEERTKQRSGSIKELLCNHTKSFFLIVVFSAGGSLAFYTYTTYMQKYLVTTAGFDKHTATTIMTAALFIFMLMQPVCGALADKIGVKTVILIWSVLAAIFTLPGMKIIRSTDSAWIALLVIVGLFFIMSFYTSISGIVKSAMFPSSVRAIGVGMSHAIGNALLGGSAEYVALKLKDIGYEPIFYYYITGMMLVAFAALLFAPNVKTEGYLTDDDMY
ncbi:MFS family transporter [Bartonella sp. CB178]|uniref:MFS family transporter n=1 Tax=Bartonella sp. CB178 TaxID=3112255 RepID=UPI00300DDE7B